MKSANVKVRFYPQEKARLASMATRASISLSELIRRLANGTSLPDPGRYEAVNAIVKVNADLARLGNLFKLSVNQLSQALNDGRADPAKTERLIDDLSKGRRKIMESQKRLHEKIRQL